MTKIPCAVLGATGMVGQRFLQLLEDHPVFEPTVLAASERRCGQEYGRSAAWHLEGQIPGYAESIPLSGLDSEGIVNSGVKVAFSALPAHVAGDLESELARNGIWVFSNASSHRMAPHVPLLIPEVNHQHLEMIEHQNTQGKIMTNANCSTTGLVLGLEPIRHLGLKRVIVTTFQALSGAGYPGVPSLDILGNVIPFIPEEEEKMAAETKRILGSVEGGRVIDHPLEVLASCVRVPVENGHLESVVVEFKDQHTIEELGEAFAAFSGPEEIRKLHTAPDKPVIFTDLPDRPQPKTDVWNGGLEGKAGMAVTVGRLQSKGRWARFFILSHNTVRGAAGGSILNAELVESRNYLEDHK